MDSGSRIVYPAPQIMQRFPPLPARMPMPARAIFHHSLQAALRTAVLLLLLLPVRARADAAPAIDNVIVTASSTNLLLFAAVKDGFTKEMLEGVRSAIPLTFHFDVDLYLVRRAWFDILLTEHDLSHTLSYDPIRQEYQVAFSEKAQPVTTKSLEEAEQMMAELKGVEVIALKKLVPDASYLLNVKATLAESSLPAGVRSLLPFTSLWNVETEWKAIEFRY